MVYKGFEWNDWKTWCSINFQHRPRHSKKQLKFIVPNNPDKQSQKHHANHKLHKTGSQKAYKRTCGSFQSTMMIFVIVDKFSDKSAHKRANNESERNRSKNPHNQTNVRSLNPVWTSAKSLRAFARNYIIQDWNDNGNQESNSQNPIIRRNSIRKVE